MIHIQAPGVGVPAEDLSNISKPLFTTKVKGIGLELAVSRRYAHRNGGSLTVETEANKGNVFHFSEPLTGATND